MKNFTDLDLSAPILRAIQELGYETPSPIQAEALPILLAEPTDFLGLAATGTGKTAAFAIPMLEKIDHNKRGIQALVLCPTRELAIQVAGQIQLIGKYKGIKALPVYGGAGYGDQLRGLRQGVPIVVGTPGRLVDHMERGTISLENVETVVLDEADEMISMGFKESLEYILGTIPPGVSNTWLFSATMGREVRGVADQYLTNPKQVQINRTEMLPSTVEQFYYPTQEGNKPEILCRLIDGADDFYGLVFFQTKALVDEVNQLLKSRGYNSDCLHGDMDQTARDRVMRAFRERRVNVLLCTDVASRGLDVKDVTHVINYSIPRELDNYVHRIGRTARIGKSGVAMSLVTPSHRVLLGRIERMTKTKIREAKVPTQKEISLKKVARLLPEFQGADMHARALELLGDEWKQALAEMQPQEVASRFLSLMHPELFSGNPDKGKVLRTENIPSGLLFQKPKASAAKPASASRASAPEKSFDRPSDVSVEAGAGAIVKSADARSGFGKKYKKEFGFKGGFGRSNDRRSGPETEKGEFKRAPKGEFKREIKPDGDLPKKFGKSRDKDLGGSKPLIEFDAAAMPKAGSDLGGSGYPKKKAKKGFWNHVG